MGDVGEREREELDTGDRMDWERTRASLDPDARMTSRIFYHWKQIIPEQGKSGFKGWEDSTSCRDPS